MFKALAVAVLILGFAVMGIAYAFLVHCGVFVDDDQEPD